MYIYIYIYMFVLFSGMASHFRHHQFDTKGVI